MNTTEALMNLADVGVVLMLVGLAILVGAAVMARCTPVVKRREMEVG